MTGLSLGYLLHGNLGWLLLVLIIGHVAMVFVHSRQGGEDDRTLIDVPIANVLHVLAASAAFFVNAESLIYTHPLQRWIAEDQGR